MSASPPTSGGSFTAPNRATVAKVLTSSLANARVAQSLITALGNYSLNAIVATSTSQTTNFGNLQVGDRVIHLPAGSGSSSPLGRAAGYALLGASTITNASGTSIVTGSLGLYPGTSVTGAYTVSGSTDIANTAAHNAQTDASALFTSYQTLGLAGTIIPSELGGQTLSSPVAGTTVAFQFTSGTAGLSLTSGHSTLHFNGPGNYIIYTATTLTTGASGSTDLPVMVLSGGALASNIWWIVGSSATINQSVASAGAVFMGNVIAEASITLSQAGTVDGALIALTGAISTQGSSTFVSESAPQASFSTVVTAGTLPVTAVVGDLYLDLHAIDLEYNNPLRGATTGDFGIEE